MASFRRGPRSGWGKDQGTRERDALRLRGPTWFLGGCARRRTILLLLPIAAVAVIAVAAVSGLHLFGATASTPPATAANALAPGSEPEFAYLATQHSNFCSLSQSTVMTYAADSRRQGACCNPLDDAKYRFQVSGLRAFSNVPEILTDPYDVPASLAKQLLADDSSITLTPAQVAVFNTASSMTHDHGWCCCRCWRWYMSEGLAKMLITKQHMGAAAIAHVVDLTNGCGGGLGSDASPSPIPSVRF